MPRTVAVAIAVVAMAISSSFLDLQGPLEFLLAPASWSFSSLFNNLT